MLGSVCDAVVCAAACPVLVVAPAVQAKGLPRQEVPVRSPVRERAVRATSHVLPNQTRPAAKRH